jgi:hypothetical protein
MSSSPNLNIPLLAESQSSKYVTVNEAIDLIDAALTGLLVVAMADANVVLTAAQALGNMVFDCTGADTADRNLIVPTNEKLYVVKNGTSGGHNIIVKTASGTGVTLGPSAGYVICYCDGTNVNPIAASTGGSGATAFVQLSDAPASYSGDGGFAVEVNSGATALVFNAKPFDVSVFAPGVGSNSQKLARIVLARAVSFPAGAANSQAKASATATGSTTFTLTKNGTAFATVNFAASASVGTWTQASPATFAAGDVLEIDGPATADGSLADVGITLSGTRT